MCLADPSPRGAVDGSLTERDSGDEVEASMDAHGGVEDRGGVGTAADEVREARFFGRDEEARKCASEATGMAMIKACSSL